MRTQCMISKSNVKQCSVRLCVCCYFFKTKYNRTILFSRHGFWDVHYITFTSTLVIPCIAIITFVVWVQKQLRLNRIWKSVLLAKVLHHLPTNPAFSRRSLCQIVMTAFGPFRVVRLFRAVIVRMVMTKGSIFYHLR